MGVNWSPEQRADLHHGEVLDLSFRRHTTSGLGPSRRCGSLVGREATGGQASVEGARSERDPPHTPIRRNVVGFQSPGLTLAAVPWPMGHSNGRIRLQPRPSSVRWPSGRSEVKADHTSAGPRGSCSRHENCGPPAWRRSGTGCSRSCPLSGRNTEPPQVGRVPDHLDRWPARLKP